MDDTSPRTPRDVATGPAAGRAGLLAMTNYLLLLVAVAVLLIFAQVIVVSVLVGLGLGVILAPVLQRWQTRFRIPAGLGAVLLALAMLLGVAGILWGVFTIVESQLALLAERLPQMIAELQGRLSALLSRHPWLERQVRELDLAATAGGVGAVVFRGAWSGVAVLASLFFAAIIGIYIAAESRLYARGLIQAFPARRRARAADLLGKTAGTVRTWFRAQLIDMAIVGTLTTLGLWAVGLDYWLLLGLLTALFGVIPYVGIAGVVLFAILVTLTSDPELLPWVAAVFIITQQLESHVILPLVMRGRAELPAVPLLVFMLLMGAWAGLLGVLIAPPLFAIIRLLYVELYLPRMDAATDAAPPQPPPQPPP